jgi:ATP-binding cassette subfamily C protein
MAIDRMLQLPKLFHTIPARSWRAWQNRSLQSRRVKTPTLLQIEVTECGAAALGIILAYYGRIVPLSELRIECGVSRNGSKAGNIIKAAQRYGLIAKGYKHELEELKFLRPPYIVFWNFNHFLVVEGFSRKRVYLNDPSGGRRSVSWQEFDEGFTGVVLTFEPGAAFEKKGRQPSVLLALMDRLQGSVGAIAYSLLTGFLLVIPGVILPVLSQLLIDRVLIQDQANWLYPLLIGMALTALLQGCLLFLQLRFLRKLKIKLSMSMSSQFLRHLLRLPVEFYAQRFAGEISDRLQINNKVAETLSGQLATTVISTVMLVFYASVMFAYDGLLTLIGITFAALNLIALQVINRRRVDANMCMTQDRGKATGVAIAGLQSIETVKASGLEPDLFARWAGYDAKVINAQQNLESINQSLSVFPSFLHSIATLLILVVGGLRVLDGGLSVGMLIALQSLMNSLLEPVHQLVNFGSTLQELEGDLKRLDDVLQHPVDSAFQAESSAIAGNTQLSDAESLRIFPSLRLRGQLELRSLTFGYSRVDAPLIQDFNLSVQPGQRVALVGRSGSGKSTIAKLVSGLYQPWSGEIVFDGIPRANIASSILINSLSMVEQEIFLFSGTVRDNLTLWDATISQAQLVRACQDAEVDEAIQAMPNGFEAQLMEAGANLSGGQRQRLEIARALIPDPSILILDEATSALDADIEMRVMQNLRHRGCTCLVVAHRLSTIRDCDEIIVMEGGAVVERGKHQDLWAAQGIYADLIRSGGAD